MPSHWHNRLFKVIEQAKKFLIREVKHQLMCLKVIPVRIASADLDKVENVSDAWGG